MKKVWESIKAAGTWLRKLFEDPNGVPSSKRIMSAVLFGVAVKAVFSDVEIGQVITLFSAALALQGVTVWQK